MGTLSATLIPIEGSGVRLALGSLQQLQGRLNSCCLPRHLPVMGERQGTVVGAGTRGAVGANPATKPEMRVCEKNVSRAVRATWFILPESDCAEGFTCW